MVVCGLCGCVRDEFDFGQLDFGQFRLRPIRFHPTKRSWIGRSRVSSARSWCSSLQPRPGKSKEDRRLINWVMWIMCPPTHMLLTMYLSGTILKTTKPWSKWWLKDEVRRWDTSQEPTELLSIGCSTELTWNQGSKWNMMNTKKPTRWHSDQRKFLKRWMESPSLFVQDYEFLDVFLFEWTLQRWKQSHVWCCVSVSKGVRKSLHKVSDLEYADGRKEE